MKVSSTMQLLDSCKRRKLTMESSSDHLIDELPDDLLVKILCQLPCKSAVQCKAVCKRWWILISDPDFVQRSINKHHQLHKQSYKCLDFVIQTTLWDDIQPKPSNPTTILHSISSIPDSESLLRSKAHLLEFVPCIRENDPQTIDVLACFDDLIVCCKGSLFQSIYYICNPITKQWLKLPPVPECHESVRVGFVCYPRRLDKTQTRSGTRTTNNTSINIGDYSFKLVRIPWFKDLSYNINVEMFCSETGKWSQSMVSSPKALHSLTTIRAFVALNGILHWVNGVQSVVAYDPSNNVERCRIIDPPADSNTNVAIECLGVCRGRLRILKFNGLYPLFLQYHEDEVSFTVWELEDYRAGKWRLEHKVEVKDMIAEESLLREWTKSPVPCVSTLAFHPFDADMVYLDMRPYLASYNMRSRKLKVVNDQLPTYHRGNFIPYLVPAHVFSFVHSWWPTPIPPLPPNLHTI